MHQVDSVFLSFSFENASLAWSGYSPDLKHVCYDVNSVCNSRRTNWFELWTFIIDCRMDMIKCVSIQDQIQNAYKH